MEKRMHRMLANARDKVFANLQSKLQDIDGRTLKLESDARHLVMMADRVDHMLNNHAVMPISEKEIVAKIFNGLKMYLDPRDVALVPHLALDGIWEGFITHAWLSVVGADDTVLDIGANFGYFGVLAAQKTNPKSSKVVMFEPNPNLIPYIRKTLAVNWLNEQSTIEHMGIADKAGSAELNILKDYVGCSSMHSVEHLDAYLHDKMYLEVAEKITVPTISVDEYCAQHDIKAVDLIKIDIEGYEAKAYEGMRHIIRQSPHLTLFLEFTKESYDDPKGFYQKMLDDFGALYEIKPDGAFELVKDAHYEHVLGGVDDWKMLVFSKKRLPARQSE